MFLRALPVLAAAIFVFGISPAKAATSSGILENRPLTAVSGNEKAPLRLAQRRKTQKDYQHLFGRRERRPVAGMTSNRRRMSTQRASRVRRQIMRGQNRRRVLTQTLNRQRIRRQQQIRRQQVRRQQIRRQQYIRRQQIRASRLQSHRRAAHLYQQQRDKRRRAAGYRDNMTWAEYKKWRRKYQRLERRRKFQRDIRRYGVKGACRRHRAIMRGGRTADYSSICGSRG